MKKIKAVLFTIAAVLLITSNANAGSFLSFSIGDNGHHSGTAVGFSLNLDNHYPTYGYSVRRKVRTCLKSALSGISLKNSMNVVSGSRSNILRRIRA